MSVNIISNLNDIKCSSGNYFFIVDEKLFSIYRKQIVKLINHHPFYLLNAKEENKNLTEIENFYRKFLENDVNRSTIIIAIGGGITTDMASFAASTFKRGCRLQLVPSTFLGMIDAAIGGKTAVNYAGIKNSIGTIYPADKIYIYSDFLHTLPKEELLDGWAECVKIALIENGKLLESLQNKKISLTKQLVMQAIAIKKSIVELDINDLGERRKLNLGHTFAHILESISKHKIRHGEAVSMGIMLAAEYSYKQDCISLKKLNIIKLLLKKYNLLRKIPQYILKGLIKDGEQLLLQDKKTTKKINLILFKEDEIIEFPIDEPNKLITFIENYIKLN